MDSVSVLKTREGNPAKEYQAITASHSPMRLVIFMTSANPLSSIQTVSGELGILQSNVVLHLHDRDESTRNYRIVPHVAKITQNLL